MPATLTPVARAPARAGSPRSRGSRCGQTTKGGVRSAAEVAVTAEQPGSRQRCRSSPAELLPRTPELARGMADAPLRGDPRAQRERGRRAARGAARQHRGEHRPGAAAAGATARAPTTSSSRTRRSSSCAATCAAAFRCPRCCAPTGSATRGCGSAGRKRSRSAIEDSGELAAGQDQTSAFMFAYVDKVSDVLVEEFGNERERMMRSADAAARGDGARDPRR